LSQDEVALVTGVGRRFLGELEAGKPSCQLGRSLLVADALGMKIDHVLSLMHEAAQRSFDLPDSDDGLPGEAEEEKD